MNLLVKGKVLKIHHSNYKVMLLTNLKLLYFDFKHVFIVFYKNQSYFINSTNFNKFIKIEITLFYFILLT